MIELVIAERCTACDRCVVACPMDVLEASADGPPVIARQEDCETCFMCELHCESDALYVSPIADRPMPVEDPAALLASGHVGAFRRLSGWHEWQDDPRYANEHWRMDEIFRRARGEASRDLGGNPVRGPGGERKEVSA